VKPEHDGPDRGTPLRLSSLFEQGGLSGVRQATMRKLFERFEGHFEDRLAEERLCRQEAEARFAYAALRIAYLEEELARRGGLDVLDVDPAELGVARDAGEMIRDVADALRRQMDRSAQGDPGTPVAPPVETEPPPAQAAAREDAEWQRDAGELTARRAENWEAAQRELDKAVEAWIPGDEVEPLDERFDDLQGQLEKRRFGRRGPRGDNKGAPGPDDQRL
jgi:hypothetical protein